MSLVRGLTTTEAAERLGKTLRNIQWLIKEGKLPAERVGRDYFIREKDLKLVADLKRGRPPKHPSETTRQLNQAFRNATESEKKVNKKKDSKK